MNLYYPIYLKKS